MKPTEENQSSKTPKSKDVVITDLQLEVDRLLSNEDPDPDTALKLLNNAEVDNKYNSEILNIISQLKETVIKAGIAITEGKSRPKNKGKKGEELQVGNQGNMFDLSAPQNGMLDFLKASAGRGAKAYDENGKEIDASSPDAIYRSFAKEDAAEYAKKLEAVYSKFQELGFDVKQERNGENTFYGVAFADEYAKSKKNTNPLTMNAAEIEEALAAVKAQKEKQKENPHSKIPWKIASHGHVVTGGAENWKEIIDEARTSGHKRFEEELYQGMEEKSDPKVIGKWTQLAVDNKKASESTKPVMSH